MGSISRSRRGRRWAGAAVTAAVLAWPTLSAVVPGTSVPAGAATSLLPGTQAGFSPEADFELLSPSQLAQNAARMASTGAGWVRVDLFWPNVEPSAGQFDWSEPDPVVRAAVAAGLHVLLIPDYTPKWASTPGDPVAYGQLLSAAAAHFAPMGVHDWEVWNEPNMAYAWGPPVSPTAYTATLKAGYTAVKAVDPSATVLAGSLSPAPDAADGTAMSPLTFLKGIYAAGGKGYFDAVSVHPSTFPDMPMQPDSWNPFYNLPNIHQEMVSQGDGGKKVWLTEYGAPTGTDGDAVSESTQAAMIGQAMAQVTQWPWVGPFFTYWQDQGPNLAYDEDNFGVIRYDGSAKPALSAFEAAIAPGTGPGSSFDTATTAPSNAPAAPATPSVPVPATTATPSAALVAATGAVAGTSSATCAPPALRLSAPIVGAAASPGGGGCWLVASDGGVFTHGDAVFFGSAGDVRLSRPIVGMTATPDGGGYWLVASDGGVFTYGDAVFFGSAGDVRLSRPIVGMTATPGGGGYWLVASDGGVFTYGDARFFGSAGAIRLGAPMVAIAATPDGGGYWLLASDGGVFTYGDAPFQGSASGQPMARPALSLVPAAGGAGYTIVTRSGQDLAFGVGAADTLSG